MGWCQLVRAGCQRRRCWPRSHSRQCRASATFQNGSMHLGSNACPEWSGCLMCSGTPSDATDCLPQKKSQHLLMALKTTDQYKKALAFLGRQVPNQQMTEDFMNAATLFLARQCCTSALEQLHTLHDIEDTRDVSTVKPWQQNCTI